MDKVFTPVDNSHNTSQTLKLISYLTKCLSLMHNNDNVVPHYTYIWFSHESLKFNA